MGKPGYTSVAVDNETVGLLRQLAIESRLSKAAMLRILIRNEAARRGKNMLAVELPVPESDIIMRHGVAVTMSELNILQSMATRLAQRLGITIDRAKWQEDFLRLLIPDGMTDRNELINE